MEMRQPYPILEYDSNPIAVIEPTRIIQPADAPEHCVVCFFQEVIAALVDKGQTRIVAVAKSEMGPHPLYELGVNGRRLGLFHPGVGAPLAAGLLEESIATGCRKFIVCGGAGVLSREIVRGHVVVPTSAVRDEGTSYHYQPPGRELAPSPEGVAAIEKTLAAHGVPYLSGKTWTTDAFYRETPAKVLLRKEEGCLTVEMEAAALFAVARFRGVILAQILYGGDDVSGNDWDPRAWVEHRSGREQLFWLAAEACLSLDACP